MGGSRGAPLRQQLLQRQPVPPEAQQVDTALNGACQHRGGSFGPLLEPLQMQHQGCQHSGDRIVIGSHLQAEITEGLEPRPGLQPPTKAAETALNAQLPHSGQSAAATHLQLQQRERSRGGQAALRAARTGDREPAHPPPR